MVRNLMSRALSGLLLAVAAVLTVAFLILPLPASGEDCLLTIQCGHYSYCFTEEGQIPGGKTIPPGDLTPRSKGIGCW